MVMDVKNDEEHLWNAVRRYDPDSGPMLANDGKGAWFSDVDGNQYLDGVSGLWCLNVGHGQEEIVQAAAEQMRELSYFPLTNSHKPAVNLSVKIDELLGGGYRTFFANGGSEANETAFKIVRQYHNQTGNPGKYKVISRYRAYHGSTLGALSATAQANRRVKYDPAVPGFLHVYPPYSYRSIFGDEDKEASDLKAADMLEEMINWEGEESVAAFIMEPVISGGGVIIPSFKYMTRIQEICKKYNVLLICDEVVSGFGRTGKMFGFQHSEGVQPDIVTMAKGITSGYLPLGATSVRTEIADAFREPGKDTHFRHVSTFGGHPAACAVALKNIEIIEREQLVERVEHLGNTVLNELKNCEVHDNVGEVRRIGFLIGFEMVEDKQTKEPLSDEAIGKVLGYCKQQGLIIGRNGDTVPGQNNVLIIAPPFITSEEDLHFIVNTVTEAINQL